jgi:large conductance mechanosensitive channel
MPPIGLLLGKVDFTNLFLVLKEGATPAPYNSLSAAQAAGAVTTNLGVFVNAVISFLIVAFAVFILIKAINELQAKMDKKEAQVVVKTTKACPYCCSEISINAKKCPHCTSELPVEEKTKAKKK